MVLTIKDREDNKLHYDWKDGENGGIIERMSEKASFESFSKGYTED